MTTGRWRTAILAATLIFVSSCGAVASRKAIANADFKLDHIDVTHFDEPYSSPHAPFQMNVVLNVTNPDTITAKIDRLDFTLSADGYKVAAGSVTEPLSIAPGATEQLTVPVTVLYADLPEAAKAALEDRQAVIKVDATAHVFGIPIPLHFEETKTF